MKLFALTLCLLSLNAQAQFTSQETPHTKPPLWTCYATDYQGGFGVGTSPNRSEASSRALSDCQIRSRGGVCSLSSCRQLSSPKRSSIFQPLMT